MYPKPTLCILSLLSTSWLVIWDNFVQCSQVTYTFCMNIYLFLKGNNSQKKHQWQDLPKQSDWRSTDLQPTTTWPTCRPAVQHTDWLERLWLDSLLNYSPSFVYVECEIVAISNRVNGWLDFVKQQHYKRDAVCH